MIASEHGRGRHEPRTVLGNVVRHYLRVRRAGGLRLRLTGRRLLWWCTFVFGVCVIFLAGTHLAPGLRAAGGQGIRGEWVATQCEGSGVSCVWYGEFVGPGGKVLLPQVMYTGNLASVSPGWTTPALDTGASNEVYPVTGSDRWVHDVIGLAGGALLIAALLWRAVYVRRRRRRFLPGLLIAP